MLRIHATLALSVSALFASPAAQALGFGRFEPSATLGQPLDLRIPVSLEPGENLDTTCVSAEVTVGDNKLPASLVDVSVEMRAGAGALRVRSLAPIEDLVVRVTVSAGCNARFSRTFTAFPDPPMAVAGGLVAAAPGSGRTGAAAAAPAASLPGSPSAFRRAPDPARSRASGVQAPAARPGASMPSEAANPVAGGEASSRSRAPTARNAPVVTPPTKTGQATPMRNASADRLTLDPLTPRLKLDLSEPWFTDPGMAARGAASGVDAGASDPYSETKRLAAVQDTLSALQRQGATQRAADAALRERLQQAESRAEWAPWLLGLAALLLLAFLAAVWRLRQRQDRAWWQGESQAAAVGAVQTAAGDAARPALYEMEFPPVSDAQPAHDDPAPAPAAPQAPQVGAAMPAPQAPSAPLPPPPRAQPPANLRAPAAAKRPVQDLWLSESPVALAGMADASQQALAVEELLDLEQQTDFFIALGQEESAIDQLMVHMRGSGGASPVPYLELLDIYRRRADQAAYDQVRNRFNRTFDAVAPEWQASDAPLRQLEDYPDVLQRLQAVWSEPRQAMLAIESLLFRRDRTGEVFDLPAYRDALMLYALARDMPSSDATLPTDAIDLLLPLGNEPMLETRPGELSLSLPDAIDDAPHTPVPFASSAASPSPPPPEVLALHLKELDLDPRRSGDG